MSFYKLKDNLYHIGDHSSVNGLDCNPYLLVEGDEAVLFDPGSKLDFEIVWKNITELIDPQMIKYVVLHHQDPDLCGQMPMLEQAGINAKVVTTWRTMTIIQYYDIKSEYYLVEENDYKLTFKTGRTLKFLLTPYLHFAGAFVTYDESLKTLFSSDLFGAFSYNRTLFADENYMNKMLAFHEHYMPANSVLRPVMDTLLNYQIQTILPQHGSIIAEDPKKYILALRTLECGSLLRPIKKDLMKSGGFIIIYNEVFQRLKTVFPHEEVIDLFNDMGAFSINDSQEIYAYIGDPYKLWEDIFIRIRDHKGYRWLTVIEPFLRNLCATYELIIPEVLQSSLEEAERKNLELQQVNMALDQKIQSVNERLLKCPMSGLYNETFLKSLLIDELENEDWRDVGAIVTIGIDDFSKYKLKYGANEEITVLKNLTYLFVSAFGEQSVYKMTSADFGLYIKGYSEEAIINSVEALRHQIEQSDLFLGKLTVSLGAVFNKELNLDLTSYEVVVDQYIEKSLNRLRISKLKGKNYFCYSGDDENVQSSAVKVLIVDSDKINTEVISNFIAKLGVEVSIACDGFAALELARKMQPKIIITEVILDKIDGFLLREELLKDSRTKGIEVVYVSYQKDQESVERASDLGVTHYLKKPYLLSELVGIINKKIRGIME